MAFAVRLTRALRVSIRAAAVVLLSVLACACVVWPGGTDPEAGRIKAEMEPVISGLKSYRVKHGAYPKSLALLIPEFVSSLPSHAALQYNASGGSIGFIYSPSLLWGSVAKCTTVIEKIEWRCTDYKL